VARPQLRLLIDENLSPRIARALHELGYRVEAVHDAEGLGAGDGVPDEKVLEIAKQRKQVIVTINLDMVLICIEAGEPVIWIDPRRRRSLTYAEMVIRFFEGVPKWEHLVGPDVVVHALKTKDEVLSFADARRRLLDRIAKQRRAVRHRSRRQPDPNQGELGDAANPQGRKRAE
jgi:predicted nuclease of predicted toxin-antitoxin system